MGNHLQEVAEVIERGLKVVRHYDYADVEAILVAQERFVQDLSQDLSSGRVMELAFVEAALCDAIAGGRSPRPLCSLAGSTRVCPLSIWETSRTLCAACRPPIRWHGQHLRI